MKEYNGLNPINARININYKDKKPKVKFSYPDKKNQIKGSMFVYVYFAWIVLNLPIMIYSSYYEERKGLPEFNSYDDFKSYYSLEKTLEEGYYKYSHPFFGMIKDYGIERLFLIAYFTLTPLIIYLPFKKHWNKLYPDTEALLSRKKYRKFTSKDIIKKERIYIELPIFSNVVCDFEAKKDFGKYLEEFEIQEHKFEYYRKSIINVNGKKIRKRKKNEFMWYARWYFKEIPKEGFLEVIFK